MKSNTVTLFSNGIGHFRRIYKVSEKAQKVSIPFKNDCIGDVAASLQVFGKVRLDSPPSFTPANSNATSLRIEQDEALKSLLKQLSGSGITVTVLGAGTAPEKYTLLGLDTESVLRNDVEIRSDFVVAMKDGAVSRIRFSDVANIQFDDESVRTEIGKALKTNFQQIKPDSTLLDLTLTALEGETEAVVQYTIPVAAWKMRYAVRQDKGSFVLDGAAIIDNNTDEDWDNFIVSVVTGHPISFSTDIANVVVPTRHFVRLVDDQVLGNVQVDEGTKVMGMMAAAAAAPDYQRTRGKSQHMRKMSVQNVAQFGLESADSVEEFYDVQAQAPGVDSREVGDFCVFTNKEKITILSRKSAVVPMFSAPLPHAGLVLLYKDSEYNRRPYRTVKFKNETQYSLGKGKTVIYQDGVFSGECVLDVTKPGDNRMLPHCLENGVKIVKEPKGTESQRCSLSISDGVAIDELMHKAVAKYEIENKKDEAFKVALEHSNALTGNNLEVKVGGVEIKEQEKLVASNGFRFYFDLEARQSCTLTVTETSIERTTVAIGNYPSWLKINIVDTHNPLAENKQVQRCIEVQQRIDELTTEIRENQQRRGELVEQAKRVRENLSSAKDVTGAPTIQKWVDDLDTTETEIRKIDKEAIPQLQKSAKELQKDLSKEVAKIKAEWREEGKVKKASK